MTPRPPASAPGRAPRHRGPSLARRALPAIVLSGASGLLLSVLDRPGASAGATGTDQTGVAAGVPGTVSIVTTPGAAGPGATTPPTVPATVPVTLPADTTPAITTPGATAAPTVATTPPTTPATVASTVPAAPVCSTVDGPTVQTRWGPVQVEASVTPSGQICAIDAIQSPGGRGRSISINSYAVPILDQDALAAQSAKFNGVSGATVTSHGYKQSLQALLDSLG